MPVPYGTHLKRFPYWLRLSVRDNEALRETKKIIFESGLDTVCQRGRCPNIHDCFSNKRCTFLILGNSCTRNCRFCAIDNNETGLREPDKTELFRIREAVGKLSLHSVVITSVTRDDLDDGGAGHFADCINILREQAVDLKIEVLVPDFLGKRSSIEKVISAGPDTFSHNIETVPGLYAKVRPQADYTRSLEILKFAKELNSHIVTKSGIMAGLGEGREEIYEAMKDLRRAGCDIITIGQYLRPDTDCLDVEEFLEPAEFDKFSEWASQLGFKQYYCGPFVRTSYEFSTLRLRRIARTIL